MTLFIEDRCEWLYEKKFLTNRLKVNNNTLINNSKDIIHAITLKQNDIIHFELVQNGYLPRKCTDNYIYSFSSSQTWFNGSLKIEKLSI